MISCQQLLAMQKAAEEIFVQEEMYQYVGNLVNRTRTEPLIDLGISPRGTINILQMAKAVAFLRQRAYVIPEDVEDIFLAVCGHRIIPSTKARVAHMDAEDILREILNTTPKQKTSTPLFFVCIVFCQERTENRAFIFSISAG